MVGLGLEYGLAVEACLAGSGIEASDLDDEHTLVSAAQELRVIENLVGGLPDVNGLGLQAGRRYQITTFGIWAFAIISSPNLRAALDVAGRFTELSFILVRFSMRETDDVAEILMDADHIPERLHQFVLERHLAVLLCLIGEILGNDKVRPREIHLTLPGLALEYLPGAIEPGHVHLNATKNSVVFDRRLLELESPKANAATSEFCIRQCEELLDKRAAQSGFSGQVRSLLIERIASIPTLAESAEHFAMSPRTFRRRLESEGNNYRSLVEQTREGLALELLDTARLSVESVAERLGYAETSSFIHAFKRWTGQTPAQFRKKT